MSSMHLIAELHVRQFVSRQKVSEEEKAWEDCMRRGGKNCGQRPSAGNSQFRSKQWHQHAINSAGPMALIDAVCQAEEHWVELFETAPRCELPQPDENTDAASQTPNLAAQPA